MLPSVHSGHSVIDLHRIGVCGLKPQHYQKEWFLPRCSDCPANQWCYNVTIPNGQIAVEQLVEIYHCYLEIAIQRGINPFALLIHLPYPEDYGQLLVERYGVLDFRLVEHTMPKEDLPIFIEAIKKLKAERENILVAVEVDFLPKSYSNKEILEELVRQIPDILIIGSVHAMEVDGTLILQGKRGNDKNVTDGFIKDNGLERFWEAVLKAHFRMLSQVKPDVLGHLFAFQKYVPKCPKTKKITSLIYEIIDLVVHHRILVDVNTSGFVKGVHMDDPYFPAEWAEVFREAGAQFVTGDDSHGPAQIGQAFLQCREWLVKNGINTLQVPTVSAAGDRIVHWTPYLID